MICNLLKKCNFVCCYNYSFNIFWKMRIYYFCMLELRILARNYKAEKNIFRVINGMNRRSVIWCGKGVYFPK